MTSPHLHLLWRVFCPASKHGCNQTMVFRWMLSCHGCNQIIVFRDMLGFAILCLYKRFFHVVFQSLLGSTCPGCCPTCCLFLTRGRPQIYCGRLQSKLRIPLDPKPPDTKPCLRFRPPRSTASPLSLIHI